MPSIKFNKFLKWLKSLGGRPGSFRYDALTGALTVGEKITIFRPKTAAVFDFLLSKPDRIISKSELLDEVWGEVIVQEQAVFQSITEIRQAFADPMCIRTQPGKGYQWVGGTPQSRKAPIQQALPYIGLAAILLAIFTTILPIKTSPPGDRPHIMVVSAVQSNVAARDTGLPSMLTDMLNHHISANGIGYPVKDPATANISVTLRSSRVRENLNVHYKIEGDAGTIEGEYVHTSITWIIHQIAHQLHDAATYSFIKEAPEKHISLHLNKIDAEALLAMGDREGAADLLKKIIDVDPSFLSATYELLNLERSAPSTVFKEQVALFMEASIKQHDAFNEIRALLLDARLSADTGDYAKAIQTANKGYTLAQSHHYPYLEASFDLWRGRWEAGLGLTNAATNRFESAVTQYQLIECPAGEITALELLADNLETLGDFQQASQSRQKATALKALGY